MLTSYLYRLQLVARGGQESACEGTMYSYSLTLTLQVYKRKILGIVWSKRRLSSSFT